MGEIAHWKLKTPRGGESIRGNLIIYARQNCTARGNQEGSFHFSKQRPEILATHWTISKWQRSQSRGHGSAKWASLRDCQRCLVRQRTRLVIRSRPDTASHSSATGLCRGLGPQVGADLVRQARPSQ